MLWLRLKSLKDKYTIAHALSFFNVSFSKNIEEKSSGYNLLYKTELLIDNTTKLTKRDKIGKNQTLISYVLTK